MNGGRIAAVLAMTMAMCALSGPGRLRRSGGPIPRHCFDRCMAFRKIPLARKNLTHNVRRLAVALAGIGFAVVLMFMQMGFRNALFDSTVKIVADMDADIVLVNRARYTLPARQSFDFKRILQARSCPGVAAVYPVYTESFGTEWKPAGGGKPYSIRVIAFDPDDPVFLTPEVRARQRPSASRTRP